MSDETSLTLRQLTQQFSQLGNLDAIYLRPARGVNCVAAQQVQAIAQKGLVGDRTSNSPSRNALAIYSSDSKLQGSKRQITLIQAEHIAVISALMGKPIAAAKLRRNLVISGINLLAAKSLFKDQLMLLTIGEVILQVTGPCEPCSKMELELGRGGYNAMRGHGGITARIMKGGELKLGDAVYFSVAQS